MQLTGRKHAQCPPPASPPTGKVAVGATRHSRWRHCESVAQLRGGYCGSRSRERRQGLAAWSEIETNWRVAPSRQAGCTRGRVSTLRGMAGRQLKLFSAPERVSWRHWWDYIDEFHIWWSTFVLTITRCYAMVPRLCSESDDWDVITANAILVGSQGETEVSSARIHPTATGTARLTATWEEQLQPPTREELHRGHEGE